MNICCIADPHLREFEIPPADIIIVAGDLTMNGNLPEMCKGVKWLESLPCDRVIFVAGNHDFFCEEQPLYTKEMMAESGKIIYLHDKEITIEGIKIYGSPYQPFFGGWAFNLQRGEPLKQKWAQIPKDLDILITHGPAWGYGDEVTRDLGIHWEPDEEGNQQDFGYKTEHVGCQDLLNRIKEVKPLFHISGHIHKGYGMKVENGITFINASVCNERYEPVNKPVIIEI